MRHLRYFSSTLFLLLLWTSIAWTEEKPRTISFDALGAGTSAGQGTFAFSINPQGTVAGYYVDSNNVNHGFLRTKRGDLTTFDAPGAGTSAGQGTLAFGSNPEGAIAGFYADSNFVYHGFVRAPDGNITTFDAPGAGGTFAAQINPAGVIAGDYFDASFVSHAYLRAPDGKITTFDAPGAGTGAGQGTMTGFVDCINPEGAMVGYYLDASNVFHGYLRAPDGKITTFDAPSASTGAFQGTLSAGVDPARTITGQYFDASNAFHGFVRTKHGDITTFDVSGAGTGGGQGTGPNTINTSGAVTGNYVDASGVNHGFLRTKRGDLFTLMFRARVAVAARARHPSAATRREELRDSMRTQAVWFTAFCCELMIKTGV